MTESVQRVLKALDMYGKLAIIDQKDLWDDYHVTWEDINRFCALIEKLEFMKSDNSDEDGFEEVIWEAKIEGVWVRDTTVYGIGSFSCLELMSST